MGLKFGQAMEAVRSPDLWFDPAPVVLSPACNDVMLITSILKKTDRQEAKEHIEPCRLTYTYRFL